MALAGDIDGVMSLDARGPSSGNVAPSHAPKGPHGKAPLRMPLRVKQDERKKEETRRKEKWTERERGKERKEAGRKTTGKQRQTR